MLSEARNQADVQTQLNISYSTSHTNRSEGCEARSEEENNYEYMDTPASVTEGGGNDMYMYIPTVVRVGTRKTASGNGTKSNTLAAIIDDGEYI